MGNGDRGYGPVFAAAPDATGGALTLDVRDPRAVHAAVIDLVETVDVLAEALDIPWRGALRHGFCWGLLVPEGDGASVVVMGRTPADLEGPGVRVGRIAESDARRFRQLWAGRAARVSVLVEATPGSFALEVRYRSVPADPPAVPEPRPAEPAEAPAPAAEPSEDDTPTWAAAAAAAASGAAAAAQDEHPEPEVTAEPAWTPAPEVEPMLAGIDTDAETDTDTDTDVGTVAAATWVASSVDVAPEVGARPDPEPSPVVTDPALLMPPGVPAGWYVDPFDADELRWWDGTRWSLDAAPRPVAQHDET